MSWPARCPRQVPPGAMGTGVVGSIEPGLSQDVGGPAGAVGRRSCRLSTPITATASARRSSTLAGNNTCVRRHLGTDPAGAKADELHGQLRCPGSGGGSDLPRRIKPYLHPTARPAASAHDGAIVLALHGGQVNSFRQRRLPATAIGGGQSSHPTRDVYRPRTPSNASSSWGCGAVSGGMLCSAMNFIMVGTS